MEHSLEHSQHARAPSFTATNLPSSSSSSAGVHEEEEEENNGQRNSENLHHHQHQEQQQQQQFAGVFYHLNMSIPSVARIDMRHDIWSCVVVLITFWFFAASMTLILGYYGSVTLQLGPNCSRLIQSNSFFVQSIQVEELDKKKPGLLVYGLRRPSPLDVEISWIETHDTFVPPNFHKEWLFFLNKGSKVNISYTTKPAGSLPLSLVIAQGTESLVEWVEDPSYPNTTLSWNIINGSGKIQQEIPKSSNYYIAVGNLNSDEVETQLTFSINALFYDTTQAYYRCSLGDHSCTLELYLLGENAAVLSSPGRSEETRNSIWYVKISYGPRWIAYFFGSGVMTILILLAFTFCKMFWTIDGPRSPPAEMQPERAPLLPEKDDDISSWGSSYDSVSHDEEDLEQWLAVTSAEGKPSNEGESNNSRRLCVICFDAPRDCFFLPCGHCATCFTCGTRISEDAASCPICRRKMKKVRRVFTV